MNSCCVTISYSFDFEVQLRIQVFGSSHKEAPGLTFCETPKQEFSGADTNLQFSEGNFDIRCCKTAQSASPDIIFSALAEKSEETFVPKNLLLLI